MVKEEKNKKIITKLFKTKTCSSHGEQKDQRKVSDILSVQLIQGFTNSGYLFI